MTNHERAHATNTGAPARIRVLVVDGTDVVRDLLVSVIGRDPDLEVVGAVGTAAGAAAAIAELQPDAVTLSDAFPDGDGLALVRSIRRDHRTLPVIMISALDERGAAFTLDALAAGASDHVTRPDDIGNARRAAEAMRESLLPRIKALCATTTATTLDPAGGRAGGQAGDDRRPDIVAIGASTGGPNALTAILAGLPADFDRPIVITQHMPPVFTRYLAQRLDDASAIRVREARHGDLVEPGIALLAPGDVHLSLERTTHGVAVVLEHTPPVQFHRPSADVMFRSVAAVFGGDAMAVVLSGMGRDGLDGCGALKARGAVVLVQDQASSVVWEMPGAVYRAGLADAVVPLGQLAEAITAAAQQPRVTAARD